MRFLFIFLLLTCLTVNGATTNAWQRTDTYVPPDFNGFFSEDPDAGERLSEMEKSGHLDTLPPGEVISAVQKGLRSTRSRKLSILRTFGNRFIWGKSPQNPDAIELMYHAVGCPKESDGESTASWGIYFGLSVVKDKSANILRALVDFCMKSDDPNSLDRVAWGIRSQQEEGLTYLQTYLASADTSIQKKAKIVEGILTQKINAFEWAKEESRKKAEITYRQELPEIKRLLAEGTSQERSRVLEKIFRGAIVLIMDDSFLPAFSSCASDSDARVRENVAKLVGENWIWFAKVQNVEAIELILKLTRDPNPQVRYDAIYHGLSTVREKSDEILQRLVDMFFKENIADVRGRISWSLNQESAPTKAKILALIAPFLNDSDAKVAELAAGWYKNLSQNRAGATANPALKTALGTNAIIEIRKRLEPEFHPFVLQLTDGQSVILATREKVAVGDQLIVIVETEDHVRTVDARQIIAIEDIPAVPRKN